MQETIFRENDIRGTYPEEINELVMKDIAIGIAKKCKSEGVDSIAVARDGRLSGEPLLTNFCEAILNCGIDVNCIGLATSPMLYFAAKKEKSKSGIMITGSHNPKNYNGIKMVINNSSVSGNEILKLISNAPLDIYQVPRKNFFMGRWIKYSGWHPNYRQPQLFKNGKMSYTVESVHEGYISHSNKEIGTISNIIWQFPFKNTEEIIHKTNRYSSLGVKKLQGKGVNGNVFKAFLHGFWSFIKHYIFKLGFLDGGPGFVIAFGNFEGTFYRYIKLMEAQKNWTPPTINPIDRSTK